MTKENIELKLHINTNVVEINVEGKTPTYERLEGVILYNGETETVYGSTEEISVILTKAVEDNKAEEATPQPDYSEKDETDTSQPEDSEKDESNTSTDDKLEESLTPDSTPNKKPTTGLQAFSGVLGGILVTLIGYKGLVTKKENN